jgi:peptidoglycan/LPS O-acetylase OafA/YrhL
MRRERKFGLDLLRAIAILTVVYRHTGRYVQPYIPERIWRIIGIDGVGIFFVLSGYLIGGVLLKTIQAQGDSFKTLFNFWLRRWFRTLPNYYLVLAALIAIEVIISHRPSPPLSYLVFLQNFAWPQRFFGESWSLCVEEWFYLLVPIALFVAVKFSKNLRSSFLWIMIAVLALSIAARVVLAARYPWQPGQWEPPTREMAATRLDSIMLGCLMAWIAAYRRDWWGRFAFGALVAGVVFWFLDAILHAGRLYCQHLNLLVVPTGTALMLPWASRLKPNGSALGRSVTFISEISYSMYILNYSFNGYVVERSFRGLHESPGVACLKTLTFVAVSFLLPYLLHRFWERPMMDLRDARSFNRVSATTEVASSKRRASDAIKIRQPATPGRKLSDHGERIM